jgi:hypothetical protein
MKKIIILLIISLNILNANEKNYYNILINPFGGIGLENQFLSNLKIGGFITIPQKPRVFESEQKSSMLISTYNEVIGVRYSGPIRYKLSDILLYLDFSPWKLNNFYLSFIYKYETPFRKEISNIPLNKKENFSYIELENPYYSSRINFLSYEVVYPTTSKVGVGLSYDYWINNKYFFKFQLGFFIYSKSVYPNKIIFFPDPKKWIFYANKEYKLETLLLQERDLKENLEKNDNINYAKYGILQFSVGFRI